MELTSEWINSARDTVRAAERRREHVVRMVQIVCPHKEVAECNYRPSDYFDALPPIRICLHCGMTEDGWGCGYLVLGPHHADAAMARIDRDELYRLRQGLSITDKHKGPLLRQEVTVDDLISAVK